MVGYLSLKNPIDDIVDVTNGSTLVKEMQLWDINRNH